MASTISSSSSDVTVGIDDEVNTFPSLDTSPSTLPPSVHIARFSLNAPSSDASTDAAPFESIGFGCGGWLQFYLYGVARAIQAMGLDHPDIQYLGCSAGALACAGLVLNSDFDAAIKYCKDECLPRAHGSISGLFCLHEYVDGVLELQREKFYDIPENRLHVSITRLEPRLKLERKKKFSSWEDLKTSLLSSCAAFPLAKMQWRDGCWCADGGLTDFTPFINERTITVSPFYFSQCDIKPSRYVPLWWAIVPPACNHTIDWLYNLGLEDGLNYFRNVRKLAPTPRARTELMSVPSKRPHLFDECGKVSVHRVLGYWYGNKTVTKQQQQELDDSDSSSPRSVASTISPHQNNRSKHMFSLSQGRLEYLLDVTLFMFLLFVVKPLILICIYLDLFVQLGYHLVSSAIHECLEILPLLVLSTFMFYPNSLMTCNMSFCVFVEKLLIMGPSQYARFRLCWDCLQTACSPQLIWGFVCLPKRLHNFMHDELVENLCKLSFFYRFFRHAL